MWRPYCAVQSVKTRNGLDDILDDPESTSGVFAILKASWTNCVWNLCYLASNGCSDAKEECFPKYV